MTNNKMSFIDFFIARPTTSITFSLHRISLLPEHHYSHLREHMDKGATYYVRDLPYSFDFLLENLSDVAHIPVAHNALLGKPNLKHISVSAAC
jgi:hypothetical protein